MSPLPCVVVMGVSGAGKSLIGRALAARLQVPYVDADDLHAPENVERMRDGVALTDAQRAPWLAAVATWLREHDATGGVVSCSALRRTYRDLLVSRAPGTVFLHLAADVDLLRARLEAREHFMPASLLASQLDTLEPLEGDEVGLTVDAAGTPEELAEVCVSWLAGGAQDQ